MALEPAVPSNWGVRLTHFFTKPPQSEQSGTTCFDTINNLIDEMISRCTKEERLATSFAKGAVVAN
jgi:hypothetical protein